MDSSFITIGVTNMEASVVFYKDVLGYQIEREMKPGSHTHLVWLSCKDRFTIELVFQEQMPPANNQSSSITLTYQIPDLTTYKDQLMRLDVAFKEMALGPGVEALRFHDPNGVAVSLVAQVK